MTPKKRMRGDGCVQQHLPFVVIAAAHFLGPLFACIQVLGQTYRALFGQFIGLDGVERRLSACHDAMLYVLYSRAEISRCLEPCYLASVRGLIAARICTP